MLQIANRVAQRAAVVADPTERPPPHTLVDESTERGLTFRMIEQAGTDVEDRTAGDTGKPVLAAGCRTVGT